MNKKLSLSGELFAVHLNVKSEAVSGFQQVSIEFHELRTHHGPAIGNLQLISSRKDDYSFFSDMFKRPLKFTLEIEEETDGPIVETPTG